MNLTDRLEFIYEDLCDIAQEQYDMEKDSDSPDFDPDEYMQELKLKIEQRIQSWQKLLKESQDEIYWSAQQLRQIDDYFSLSEEYNISLR
jgi:ElaB/YqjD/DUF883 family membrane-anchored ribosome-binding protein